MARIYLVLAVFAVALLAFTMIQGYQLADLRGPARELQDARAEVQRLQAAVRSDPTRRDQLEAARQRAAQAGQAVIEIQKPHTMHFMVGLFATLVATLVNCISVTYFIGTTRWVKEVSDTYQLDPQLWDRARAIKRRSFPWSVGGVLVAMGMVTVGAAADPTANGGAAATWVTPHAVTAYLGTLLIAWSFLQQMLNVGRNYDVIEQVLRLVVEKGGEIESSTETAA